MILIFNKLLKSKKAGVPLVNEIILLLQKIIPKPVWVLIFLLLVTLIGSFLVPSILNFFGYECLYENNELTLYQVPLDKIISKSVTIDLKQQVRSFFSLPEFEIPQDPFPNGDKRYFRIPPDCFSSVQNGSDTIEGYTAMCVDCPFIGMFYKIEGTNISTTQSVVRAENSICMGDGYYKPSFWTLFGVWEKSYCYKCAPPNPYYYNHSNCISKEACFFTIINESDVPFITTEYAENIYLARIKELGGVKRTQDSSEFVNIQCEEKGQPQLFFFNIKIFNPLLMIYLTIGYVLIIIAYFWYSMLGINR